MKRLIILSFLLCATPALASSSAWHQAEGGQVRLVTVGEPDAEGRLRGLLDIRLDPGWKTYWRDPGDVGVPPTLDLGGQGSAELLFPAPEWHHDGAYDWAGYASSVALPVTLRLTDPAGSGPITATAFLGLCKTVCIPLKAEFVLDPASDPDNPGDSLAVLAAETGLPDAASADFGVTAIRIEDERAIFDISGPVGKDAELFVAGSEGFAFSRPEPTLENGKLIFTSKVKSYLKAKPKDAAIQYTLKTAGKSVSGKLPF
jgi:DsbC/DsbD-like thiol-disulfide interchange protein